MRLDLGVTVTSNDVTVTGYIISVNGTTDGYVITDDKLSSQSD